jgi:GTP-binding protein
VVDVAPFDDSDPVEATRAIAGELERFSATLAQRPRWLVLNKLDLLPEDEREARAEEIVSRLDWTGPVFRISAIAGEGTQALVQAVHRWLTEQRRLEAEDDQAAEREAEMRRRMEAEAVARAEQRLRGKRRQEEDDDDFDEDDYDVDVEYVE